MPPDPLTVEMIQAIRGLTAEIQEARRVFRFAMETKRTLRSANIISAAAITLSVVSLAVAVWRNWP
jgi:hypothetical protein